MSFRSFIIIKLVTRVYMIVCIPVLDTNSFGDFDKYKASTLPKCGTKGRYIMNIYSTKRGQNALTFENLKTKKTL